MLPALVAGLCAAACSGEATKPATPSLSGKYELIEVNDAELAYTILLRPGFYRRQIVGGTLEFRDQNQVLDALSLRNVDGAGAALTEGEAESSVATYSLSGNEIVVPRPVSAGAVTYADTGAIHGALLGLNVRDAGVRFPGLDLHLLYRKL